jgi:hypothetical protein
MVIRHSLFPVDMQCQTGRIPCICLPMRSERPNQENRRSHPDGENNRKSGEQSIEDADWLRSSVLPLREEAPGPQLARLLWASAEAPIGGSSDPKRKDVGA